MASLSTLPTELLLKIRSSVPLHLIRDHIALSSACRATRFIYLDADKFWEAICLSSGIGLPACGEVLKISLGDAFWHKIAVSVVNHTMMCTKNGEACISWLYAPNTSDSEHSLIPRAVLSPDDIAREDARCSAFSTRIVLDLVCLPYFGRSAFSQPHSPVSAPGSWTPLEDHVAGMLTFATYPPLTRMELSVFDLFTVTVENAGGITILDVLRSLGSHLGIQRVPLTLREFALLYCKLRLQKSSLSALDWLTTWTLEQLSAEGQKLLQDGMLGVRGPTAMRVFEDILNAQLLPYVHLSLLNLFAQMDVITVPMVVDALPDIVPHCGEYDWFKSWKQHATLDGFMNHAMFGGIVQEAPGSVVFKTLWTFDDSIKLPRPSKRNDASKA